MELWLTLSVVTALAGQTLAQWLGRGVGAISDATYTCGSNEEVCRQRFCLDLTCDGSRIKGSSDGRCKCMPGYIRQKRYGQMVCKVPAINCVRDNSLAVLRGRGVAEDSVQDVLDSGIRIPQDLTRQGIDTLRELQSRLTTPDWRKLYSTIASNNVDLRNWLSTTPKPSVLNIQNWFTTTPKPSILNIANWFTTTPSPNSLLNVGRWLSTLIPPRPQTPATPAPQLKARSISTVDSVVLPRKQSTTRAVFREMFDQEVAKFAKLSNLYTLYNPIQRDHMYTTSSDEVNTYVAMGYQFRGTAAKLPEDAKALPSGCASLKILNGFYRVTGLNDHFYTVNRTEEEQAKKLDFGMIGRLGYCAESRGDCGATIPWHRFYNNGFKDHMYVTTSGEAAMYAKDDAWLDEGVECFLWPNL